MAAASTKLIRRLGSDTAEQLNGDDQTNEEFNVAYMFHNITLS
jgi:hypothetical protein